MSVAGGTAVEDDVPLVDPAVLMDLRNNLDSPVIALKFAGDYTGMWELRRSRLAAALNRGDLAAAMDAVISLRVSSTMVGGRRLAALAQQLEEAVSRADFATARQFTAAVDACGEETVNELRLFLAISN